MANVITATMLRGCRIADVVKCTDGTMGIRVAVKAAGNEYYPWTVDNGRGYIRQMTNGMLADELSKARRGTVFIQRFEQTAAVNA